MRIDSATGANSSLTGSFLSQNGVLSSSAQIASEISGSSTSLSSSLASRITTEENNVDVLQAHQSNIHAFTASADSEITSLMGATSSYAAKTAVSGAFTSTSASIASDIASNLSNITSIGSFTASLDSDITTFSLPASTTISTFGKSLVDDADAATARTTLDVDQAGTDNSTDVTLVTTSHDYLSLAGQAITLGTIDISDDTNLAVASAGASQGDVNLTLTGDTLSAASIGLGTSNSPTFVGLTLTGDLEVQGTTTTVDSTTVNIGDNIISVNGTGAVKGGLAVNDVTGGSTTTGSLLWDGANDYWVAGPTGSENEILTTGNVDADIKTLSLPANTTISTFGASLVDDADAATARTTLGLGSIATLSSIDISTNTNLAASTGITLTGDTLTTNDGQIVHDNLSGFVADEHVAHSTVSITAGAGLTGGGTIAATRTLNIGAGTGVTVNADDIAIGQAVGTSDNVQFNSLGVGTAGSATTGEIRATNDITAFYSSDERLKENIVTLDGALDKVKAMRGVTFDWKPLSEEERKIIHSHEGHDLGVIAQEVQAQYPELVHQREHGYLSVDYVKLTAVLIEAVKELSAKVDELTK